MKLRVAQVLQASLRRSRILRSLDSFFELAPSSRSDSSRSSQVWLTSPFTIEDGAVEALDIALALHVHRVDQALQLLIDPAIGADNISQVTTYHLDHRWGRAPSYRSHQLCSSGRAVAPPDTTLSKIRMSGSHAT
jgi:hypothetical protein